MAWSAGIEFRATAGYVSTAPGDTYCIGDVYPTTRGGITFGWASAPGTRDRSTGAGPQLAGINFGKPATFQLNLPSPGMYTIQAAHGDKIADQDDQSDAYYDNATLITTITGSAGAGEYIDATNVLRASYTLWYSSNAPLTHTFASSILKIVVNISGGSNNGVIAYLLVTQLSGNSPNRGIGTGGNLGGTRSGIRTGGMMHHAERDERFGLRGSPLEIAKRMQRRAA